MEKQLSHPKNAEDQLSERESLYRTMFERSPFSVVLTDLSGVFVDVNEKFVQNVGVPREEAIGRTPAELGMMDRKALAGILDATEQAGGNLQGYEVLIRTRSGETRCELLSGARVNLGDERLVLYIINDITERRQAEDSLRRSEEKYRELVQDANSIILRWGRDGVVHFFNEFAQQLFGYTEKEILGRSVVGTIVPDTETSGRDLKAMIADITAHPEYHGTNVNENMCKNGERVWIAWTNKPVFDDHGKITEILSVGLDITQRIRAQQALQQSEARYRSIFNSNVDAFLLFDTDGRIVDANTRAGELYGYSRDELIGLRGSDLATSGFDRLFESFESLAMGEWFQRASTDTRRDGTAFDVEIHGARLHYGGSDRLLAILFDVTDRNRARESMQLFSNVVENMQVGLYIYHLEDPDDDRTLKLVAANPASTTDLGLSENDAVGKYIDEVLPSLREHNIPKRLADVARTGTPYHVVDLAYSDERLAPRHYSFRAFRLPGTQVGVLFEDITEAVQAEEDKNRFYRSTIEAATDGKLIICDREEIQEITGPLLGMCEIARPRDVLSARHVAAEIAEVQGMDEPRLFDLALCVGEAATNVIKHAGRGMVSVHMRGDAVLVLVSDSGPGIQAINLPFVALKKGHTTAVSLGMGYKAMLSIADKVRVATGPAGTTVAIEMGLHPAANSPAGA